jgi:tetratricopeptide (TPR) repeat protein
MLPRSLCVALIAVCLCGAAHAGPDQWIEVRSPHFTVVTDAGEKQGRHIAEQFERMRWLFQTLYPTANVDPAEATIVIAAKNEKVFETMEPAVYLAKGQMKLGGYYSHSQEKNYILLQLDTQYEHPFATVYHEYTHLQFAFASAWMPVWLNEGLAEFMQNTEIRDKDVLLGEPSADDILYLRQNRLIPLSVLFKIDAQSPYYHEEQKGSVFYAEAWALTHYLMVLDHNKHTNQIGSYMSRVSGGEDSLAAAEKAFGDLTQLQKAMERYIYQASYTEFVLSSAAAPIDESTYKVAPLTQVEIDTRRADVLTYVNRESEARALLEPILKEDPNNVLAHETMGTLEFRAGHLEEARKWYGEAVKLDSTDYLAYYYFASLSMNAPAGPDDKEIEDSLRKAIQLNPRFAPSYDRLAVFYTMRHENLDEAHLLSVQAVQLDPGQVVFRQNCANVLMALQRYDDAVNVLKAAETVAKNPGQISSVQFQIEQIERFQKQRAEAEAYRSAHNGDTAASSTGGTEVVSVVADRPQHPEAPKNAAKHAAMGVIHDVVCSYPMVVELKLTTVAGKSLSLYNNHMQSIDLSAVGFTPSGSMNPCKDFEGRKAKVEFAESPDKSVDGQVIAIELRK